MRYILHWLRHALSAALDRLTYYADPYPVCPECGQILDPNGDGHLATCRQWGR